MSIGKNNIHEIELSELPRVVNYPDGYKKVQDDSIQVRDWDWVSEWDFDLYMLCERLFIQMPFYDWILIIFQIYFKLFIFYQEKL